MFGNAGGGKSTLARRLAAATGLPLYVVDELQFRPGGAAVPHDEYLRMHAELLGRDERIIDGFGSVASAWERFAAADTLVLVDLPLTTHYWWVTKRLLMGLFTPPPGWNGVIVTTGVDPNAPPGKLTLPLPAIADVVPALSSLLLMPPAGCM